MKTYEEHEAAIVKVIELSRKGKNPKKDLIIFNVDIFRKYTGLKIRQFYNLNLHESHAIKNAIDTNRQMLSDNCKRDFLTSENPTLQLAGYKLICSDEDREKLATNAKVDAKLDGTLYVRPRMLYDDEVNQNENSNGNETDR